MGRLGSNLIKTGRSRGPRRCKPHGFAIAVISVMTAAQRLRPARLPAMLVAKPRDTPFGFSKKAANACCDKGFRDGADAARGNKIQNGRGVQRHWVTLSPANAL